MENKRFKLIILLVLFFVFIFLINNKSFADYQYLTIEQVNTMINDANCIEEFENNNISLDSISGLLVIDQDTYKYLCFLIKDKSSITSSIQLSGVDSGKTRIDVSYSYIFNCSSNIWQTFDGNFKGASFIMNNYSSWYYFSTDEITLSNNGETSVVLEDSGNIINGQVYENNYTPEVNNNEEETEDSQVFSLSDTQFNSISNNLILLNHLCIVQVMFLFTLFLYLFIHFSMERRKF